MWVRIRGIFSCALFIVVGIGLVVASVVGYNNVKTYDGEGVATITNIVSSEEWVSYGDENTLETVYTQYATYEVDGVKYENVDFGSCDDDTKVGDEIEIVYDTKDPTKVSQKGNSTFYIVGISGGVSVIVGIYMTIKMLKKRVA